MIRKENGWFSLAGTDIDVTVSSRIRLARNLKGMPFPRLLDDKQAEKILTDTTSAIKKSAAGSRFKTISLHNEPRALALSLMERHLISPEMVDSKGPRGLIVSDDEGVSVMVNEEDHLRIQVMGVGLCLDKCLETAEKIDDICDESLEYAFDEKLGYLTHCATNLGTGLRASVMLHLPALTETGAVSGMLQALRKLGFAVRGIYGEGTEAQGALFQISNQVTLGFTEKELIDRLNEVVLRLIGEERKARKELFRQNGLKIKDNISRALGALRFARMISSGEAINLLSEIRLGVSEGVVSGLTAEEVDKVFTSVQPGSLTFNYGEMIPVERDRIRADTLRKEFENAKIET